MLPSVRLLLSLLAALLSWPISYTQASFGFVPNASIKSTLLSMAVTRVQQNENASSNKPFVNQPTIRFNNKLNAMSRNFDKQSAQQVEDLLRKTLKDIEMGLELEIQPNVVTFTASINAWARSRQPDGAQRAEAILDWLVKLSAASNPALCLSETVPDEAEEVIDELDLADYLFVKPNFIAYNAAITAWVRSSAKDSHDRAERLLNQLWDLYIATNDPELKPNARTFNLVINAIARSREPKCADRAAALLNKMEDLYTAGDEEMEPDAQTFGAIINAYANDSSDPQSTDKAAQILQQMNSMYQLGYKNVKPNTFVYNACLNAFAKSEGNAEQATQLLEMMEQQYAKGDNSLKPDVVSYSTCINALANSKTLNAGSNADAVLRRMTQKYLLDPKQGAKPNAFTYTATIKAWMASSAMSSDRDSSILYQVAQRTEEILTTMCLLYLSGDNEQKPTKVTFDSVLEALSSIEDNEGAGRIALLRERILKHKLPRRDSV